MIFGIALFLLSSVQAAEERVLDGIDVPADLQDRNVGLYTRCLRAEVNEANERIDIDPAAPTVVQFGQLVTYCGAERRRAAASVSGYIQTRHPDWSPQQIVDGVEYFLTGVELHHINGARRPIRDGVHAPLRQRY